MRSSLIQQNFGSAVLAQKMRSGREAKAFERTISSSIVERCIEVCRKKSKKSMKESVTRRPRPSFQGSVGFATSASLHEKNVLHILENISRQANACLIGLSVAYQAAAKKMGSMMRRKMMITIHAKEAASIVSKTVAGTRMAEIRIKITTKMMTAMEVGILHGRKRDENEIAAPEPSTPKHNVSKAHLIIKPPYFSCHLRLGM
jgi:hypothetical protein